MRTSRILVAGQDGADGRHPLLSRLASSEGTAGDWRWDVGTYTVASGSRAGSDIAGWDIVEALSGADIVHLFWPFTSAGEVATLVAKALGKPLALSGLGVRHSELGRSLGLVELADALILEHPDEFADPAGPPTFVFDPAGEDARSRLSAIYDGVIGGKRWPE